MPHNTATHDHDPDTAIDIHRLSQLIGLSEVTVRQRMAHGADLPRWFRIGRNIRWRLGDVLAWRDARMAGSEP